jgi:hypothetical protein
LFSNSVSRIENQAGIRFGKYGVVHTEPIKELSNDPGFEENGFSIEIALKPLSTEKGFNFVLTLHNGDDRKQLLLGQWRSRIIAMNGDDYDYKRRVKRISVKSASMSPATQLITLTSGRDCTNIYLNGQLVKSKKDLTLHIPYGDTTRLILGNSQYGKHSWGGEIYGLALFRHTLTALDAVNHFERWSRDRNFSFASKDKPLLLYYFDDKEGAKVHDYSGGNHALKIPPHMPILKKVILSPPWEGFRLNKSGVEDIVLNVKGNSVKA